MLILLLKLSVSSYNANFDKVQNYIDSRLDILEHKFLVFVCNVNDCHWVSIVVVNPFLVFDRYIAEENEDVSDKATASLDDDDFCGWCVLDSLGSTAQLSKENGFQGTFHLTNQASYGVQLFLNICVSYLKAKKWNDGDGWQPVCDSTGPDGNEKSQDKNSFFMRRILAVLKSPGVRMSFLNLTFHSLALFSN